MGNSLEGFSVPTVSCDLAKFCMGGRREGFGFIT